MRKFCKLLLPVLLVLFAFSCSSNFNEKTKIRFYLPYLNSESNSSRLAGNGIELKFDITFTHESGDVIKRSGESGDKIVVENVEEGKYIIKCYAYPDTENTTDEKYYGETEVFVEAGKITEVTLGLTKENTEIIQPDNPVSESFTKADLAFTSKTENNEIIASWKNPKNYKEIKVTIDIKIGSDYATLEEMYLFTPDMPAENCSFVSVKEGNSYRINISVNIDDTEANYITDSCEVTIEASRTETEKELKVFAQVTGENKDKITATWEVPSNTTSIMVGLVKGDITQGKDSYIPSNFTDLLNLKTLAATDTSCEFDQLETGYYLAALFIFDDKFQMSSPVVSDFVFVENKTSTNPGSGTGTESGTESGTVTEKTDLNLQLEYKLKDTIPTVNVSWNEPDTYIKVDIVCEVKDDFGNYITLEEKGAIYPNYPSDQRNKYILHSAESGKTYRITANVYLNDDQTVDYTESKEITLTVNTGDFTKENLNFTVEQSDVDGVPTVKASWTKPEAFNKIVVSIKAKDGSTIKGENEEAYDYTPYMPDSSCTFRDVVAGKTYIISIQVMLDSETTIDISDSAEITVEGETLSSGNEGTETSDGYVVSEANADLTSVFTGKKYNNGGYTAGKIILSTDSAVLSGNCSVGDEIEITANKDVTISKSSSTYSMFSASRKLKIGSTTNTITLDAASEQAVSGYNGNPVIDATTGSASLYLGPNLIIKNNENYSSRSGAVYASLGEVYLNGVKTINNKNNKNGEAKDVLPDITVFGGAVLTLGNNLDIDGVYVDNSSSSAVLPNIILASDFGIASSAENSVLKIVIDTYKSGMSVIKLDAGAVIPATQLALLEVYDKNGTKYQLKADGSVVEAANEANDQTYSINDSNYTVSNFSQLKEVIGLVTADNYASYADLKTITVTNDMAFSEMLNVYGNYKIISSSDTTFTRDSSLTKGMFQVMTNGNLELGDASSKLLTLDGTSTENVVYPLIVTNAYLKLNENCVLQNNTNNASNGTYFGGAVLTSNTSAKLIIDGATLQNNTSVKGGGAIYNTSGTVTINSGNIINNIAKQNGGAIYVKGTLNVAGGEIANNQSILSSVNSGTSGGGGAIYVTGGTVDMTGGKIVNNKCNCMGGAIYINTTGTVNITGGTIAYNQTYWGKTSFEGEIPDTAEDHYGLNIYGAVTIGSEDSTGDYNEDINL